VRMNPDIKGIIAIDCWQQPSLDKFYANLDKLIDWLKIDSLIVANYEIALDISDKSLYNTLESYSWHDYDPDILLPIIKESRTRKTSNWMLSKMTQNAFCLLDMYSVRKHMDMCVPHIQDWLIVGGSWQACTHSRPVNVYELSKLKKNFYVSTWSVYDDSQTDCKVSTEQIKNDTLCWEPAENGYFLLK